MRPWDALKRGLKNIARGVGIYDDLRKVETGVREFITDPLGFRNIGRNIPTTYTINHNVKADGKIDVSANVSLKVSADLTLKMPDLVLAASHIEQGLKEFDIFGGAFRQLIADIEDSYRKRLWLEEVKSVIQNGPCERLADEYFFEMSMVNDSTKQLRHDSAQPGYFVIERPALCRVGISLNGKEIVKDMLLEIPNIAQPTSNPIRIEKRIAALNIQRNNEACLRVCPKT